MYSSGWKSFSSSLEQHAHGSRSSEFPPYAFTPPLEVSVITAGMKTISKFLTDESGATAIEYGLIASGIALAVIAAVNGTGSKLTGTFTKITSSLK